MRSIGGFLSGRGSQNASAHSLDLLDEQAAVDNATFAVKYILNDDMDTAQELLAKDDTPFHKLGSAVAVFLQAALGFEKESMKQAGDLLHEAGSAASRYQNSPAKCGHRSPIYNPGMEFALINAETQLMAAVVAILNESVSEALKGFYNIRKAYQTLQSIANAEKQFLANRSGAVTPARGNSVATPASGASVSTQPARANSLLSVSSTLVNGGSPATQAGKAPPADDSDDDSDLEFVDAEEGDNVPKPANTYDGNLESSQDRLARMSISSTTPTADLSKVNPDDLTSIVDRFTHSGVALCMGILQLLLSLIPPAFSRLLSVVGFRGDRDNGLALLWSAAVHLDQIHGALAALVILGYHTNMGNFCEIIGHDSHPKERCRALLTRLRELYPKGGFFMLDEARMAAGEGRPDDALKVLEGDDNKAKLKQIEAFRWFEMSLNYMCVGEWEKCSAGFIKTSELNNWSPGLYYYFAACCHIELYQIHSAPKAGADLEHEALLAKKHKSRAKELIVQVKAKVGKKKLLSRQLPFDMYIGKKITKWETLADKSGRDLLDVIGVSPMQELIFLWTGSKRMRRQDIEYHLERVEAFPHRVAQQQGRTLTNINDTAWEDGVAEDELLTYHLQHAVVLQRLGRTDEARTILESRLTTAVTPQQFKALIGSTGDSWILPTAYYELAVADWSDYLELARAAGGKEDNVGKLSAAEQERAQGLLRSCAANVDTVAKWESYDLDSRFGIKVRAAQETLKKRGYL